MKTITRRKINTIVMLQDDHGNWVEDGEHLKEMVSNYYKKLFWLGNDWQTWQKTPITYPSLEHDENVELE